MEVKFSSPLVNKTEKQVIDNIAYTRFFSTQTTNFKPGEKVYILNGNYDNSFSNYKGYTVLESDLTSFVLDIPYNRKSVWNEDDYSFYTTVELVDSIEKFNYVNTNNGFEIEGKLGQKYSDKNNSIFFSTIEDMPLTDEVNTNDIFFKSFEELIDFGDLEFTNTKGELFNSQNQLSVNMLEGNSTIGTSFEMIYDKSLDVDVNEDFIVSIFNDNTDIGFWVWRKDFSLLTGQRFFELDTIDFKPNTLKILDTKFNNLNQNKKTQGYIIRIIGQNIPSSLFLEIPDGPDLFENIDQGINVNIANSFIVGNDTFDSQKIFCFYDTFTNQVSTNNTIENSVFNSSGNINPYHILNANGDSAYMPLGDGRFTKLPPIMESFLSEFKVNDITVNDFRIQSPNENRTCLVISAATDKGIVFYNYGGVWKNDNDGYIGNGFYLTKDYFDTVDENISITDPFELIRPFAQSGDFDFDDVEFWNITAIDFIGTEVINLGIGERTYIKYLVLTENYGYFLYVYDNAFDYEELIGGDFDENNIQAHVKLSPLQNNFDKKYFDIKRLNNTLDLTPFRVDAEILVGNDNEATPFELENADGDIFFPNVNASGVNVRNIKYIDNKWLINDFQNRVLIIQENGTLDLNSNVIVSQGRSLTSDEFYRIRTEIVNNQLRIWISTQTGLYMFEYQSDINKKLYYSINLDENQIPLDPSIQSNNRLKVRESFNYKGIEYKRGDILKYNNGIWIKDITHYPSYISTKHIRGGFLNDNVIFDDGLHGSKESLLELKNLNISHGIFYNTELINNNIQSRSDNIDFELEYRDENSVTVNIGNNQGYGFNYFDGCLIENNNISNGNIKNSVILENTFNRANIKTSRILGDNENLLIGESEIIGSEIKNSFIINSSFNNSILKDSDIEQPGDIKILGYQKQTSTDGEKFIDIHKFIVSENDYQKLEYNDWIVLNNIQTSTSDILEDVFLIKSKQGFYTTFYDDILNNRRIPFEVFVSKSSFNQNQTRISLNDDFSILESTQPGFFSIDIIVKYLETSSVVNFRVNSFIDSYIQRHKMLHSKIMDSNWLNGNIINPKELSQFYFSGSYNNAEVSIQQNPNLTFSAFDLLEQGSSLYLENVYEGFNFNAPLDGEYIVSINTFTHTSPQMINTSIQALIYNKLTFNLLNIEGVDFRNGLIKRQQIKQSSFSEAFNIKDISISGNNNNTINNSQALGVFIFTQNSAENITIRATKSFIYEYTLDDSLLIKSHLRDSVFSGEFRNGKYEDSRDRILIETDTLAPYWNNSEFLDGLFVNSVWNNGDFRNGRMIRSEFLGGKFHNGEFGDNQTINLTHRFRQGEFLGGVFVNGVFSDNSKYLPPVSFDYDYAKGGTNIFHNGDFRNGIFTSTDNNVSIFKGGKFLNGEFLDQSIWLDGEFRGGIFNSSYGKYLPPVWRVGDIQSSTDVNWIVNISNLSANGFSTNPYHWGSDGLTLFLCTETNTIRFAYNNLPDGEFERRIRDNIPYNIILKNVEEEQSHLLFDEITIGSIVVLQTTGDKYIFDGSEFIEEVEFIDKDIPGTDLKYESIYAWRNGIFSGGEFGDPTNDDGFNPSWETGILKGGDFYGKVWKDGVAISGRFIGSGEQQSSINPNNLLEGYNPQQTMLNYKNMYNPVQVSSSLYRNELNWKWFGLWLNGKVEQGLTTQASANIQNVLSVDNFNNDKFNIKTPQNIIMDKMVWVEGEFNNPNSRFNESIWLSGEFKRGEFINSIFNPFVERWEFENPSIETIFEFNTDLQNCIWKSGVLKSGVFYYSNFENGVIEKATMVGSHHKQGVANYLNAINVIWEEGRFRNGNWYGSPFTFFFEDNTDDIPNPFGYLLEYYKSDPEIVSNPNILDFKPITDILTINSLRLKTKDVHIWNKIDTDPTLEEYTISSQPSFASQTIPPEAFAGIGGVVGVVKGMTLSLFPIGIPQNPLGFAINASSATTTGQHRNISFTLNSNFTPSIERLEQGTYRITIVNSNQHFFFLNNFNSFSFRVEADIFDTQGNFLNSTILNQFIYTGGVISANPFVVNFIVPRDREYRLRLSLNGNINTIRQNTQTNFTMNFQRINQNAEYIDGNNKLDVDFILDFDGQTPFSIEPLKETDGSNYIDIWGNQIDFTYRGYDIVDFDFKESTPNSYYVNDIYTQVGNGAFLSGIFENGVWNSGYRGTKFGYSSVYEIGQEVDIDYNGDTYQVNANPLYFTQSTADKIPQYKTQPNIFFTRVVNFFEESQNTWRIVLEAPFLIDGVNNPSYNRLIPGDIVSISNIAIIDINDNRKLTSRPFTVTDVGINTVEFRFRYNFPLRNITIDSERHLIYVTKNVWLNGAFLNGYFEGVFNRGLIRGNREITKFENTHIINANFRGGHFKSEKVDITDSILTDRVNLFSRFNNKYRTSLIQNMLFNDDVELQTFEMVSPRSITAITPDENTDYTTFTFGIGSSTTSTAVQYIYNSDMDLVWEPEYFSSLFNQTIFNTHILNKARVGTDQNTILHNLPAGNITYDILSSTSLFTYSESPEQIIPKTYQLSLGSKYREFRTLFEANFGELPEDTTKGIPSTNNQVSSSEYGITKRGISAGNISPSDTQGTARGISTYGETDQFIHEDFMYNINEDNMEIGDGDYEQNSFIFGGNRNVEVRDRYHLLEVDVALQKTPRIIVNPNNLNVVITLHTEYNYQTNDFPRLTISNDYNSVYNFLDGSELDGYISPIDNDFIKYLDNRRQSEINNFGNIQSDRSRLTMKTFVENNFGGYRDTLKVLESGFKNDINNINKSYTVKSPLYYSLKHIEISSIPFYNYRDFDDINETKTWYMFKDSGFTQDKQRVIDNRIKFPFFAISVDIDYDTSDFSLIDNINIQGGGNVPQV